MQLDIPVRGASTGDGDTVTVRNEVLEAVPGAAVTAMYKVAYRGTREDDESPFSPEPSVAAGG